jgi:hypothetical protein
MARGNEIELRSLAGNIAGCDGRITLSRNTNNPLLSFAIGQPRCHESYNPTILQSYILHLTSTNGLDPIRLNPR